ncbi:MAG: histidinol-phosphate transaminase [Anaerolineae bacterium]|nr:histidinol-phosphate transaminase [Anaerolineae bacterium]
MNFNPNRMIRPNVASLKPYTPILPFEVLSQQLGRQPTDIIKLDANENPYGPSPLVAEALAEAPFLHIYPDPECRELRQALVDYTGLEAEYLLVGLGADELIDLTMRLFIEPGDTIINCPPTFGMYAFDADVNGAQVINVWRQPDFSINVDEIESVFAADDDRGIKGRITPKLIIVTSPNNPDGSLLGDDDLKRLLALPAVVMLDEAYVEFSGESRMQWVKQHHNLIVLRTFSKWAGLAGLRVGYGAFPPDIIKHLWKIKQPYNVPVTGQLAARISLDDRGRLLGNVAKIVETRENFYTTLAQIDWLKPYPSHTNFILVKVEGGRRAVDIRQKLAGRGILVRYYDSPALADHLRISVGLPGQMARLGSVLQQL